MQGHHEGKEKTKEQMFDMKHTLMILFKGTITLLDILFLIWEPR